MTDFPSFPAESGKRGTTEHLLTVGNGTGDGWYGEQTLVSITANAAPPNFVFDRWTGDSQFLTSATAASTYALIPTQDIRISATYKLSAAVDADSDSLLDSWEMTNFGNTTAANATTDTDRDGISDLDEFLAGTDPTSASSIFSVSQITVNADGSLTLQWPAVVGKTYTLLTSSALTGETWTPIAVGVPGATPTCSYSLHMSTALGFVRVQLEQ